MKRNAEPFCTLTTSVPDSECGSAVADSGLVTERQHVPQHVLFLASFHQVESRRLQRSNEAQPTVSGRRDKELSADRVESGFPSA